MVHIAYHVLYVYLSCLLRKKDLFQSPKAGYYIHCIPSSHGWQRATEPLPLPDARFGFPWTVKDWEKLQRKRSAKAGWDGEVNVNDVNSTTMSHWCFWKILAIEESPRTFILHQAMWWTFWWQSPFWIFGFAGYNRFAPRSKRLQDATSTTSLRLKRNACWLGSSILNVHPWWKVYLTYLGYLQLIDAQVIVALGQR